MIGALFGLFSLFDPLASALDLALYGLVLGGIAGALVGLTGHALSGVRGLLLRRRSAGDQL